jgi:hypothetical protein
MKIRTSHVSAARVASVAFAVVLLTVEGVIVAESWRGLTGFAELIGIHGVAAWGVPVTLDGVALIAALVALRAELAGESSSIYRVTLFAFTAASAAANWWHGRHVGGTEAALYLGGMSLAVAWVFALVLRQVLRYPRLTWRAWSLSVRDGYSSSRAALDAAAGAELPDVPADVELAELPKADAIRIALAHNDGSVIAAQRWLADRGVSVDRAYAHDVKRGVRGRRRRHRAIEAAPEPAPEVAA